MLRIIDARTGEPVEAAPVRRGLTRVEARATGPDLTSLRVLLVADLLVRALELGGTPVWAVLAGPSEETRLRSAAAALGVRPFEDGRDVGAGLGEAQILHVAADGTDIRESGIPAGTASGGVRVAVAPVREDSPGTGALLGPGPAPGSGDDPAVLRLALLAGPRGVPLRLDRAGLAEARETLARWRGAVAGWARRPSRPVPAEVRRSLRDAWEDDLDVPAVLEVLRQVERAGPEVADGARFETYAYADRLLGLELTRDLGAPA
ncbi:hypothetical protein [Streptomyces sp. NPDC093094]|uniref:hypothetical protein n=1 Tax=Streptomyces sp. NPDC093094 TaxID=3366026 RepID=UPI00382D3B2A